MCFKVHSAHDKVKTARKDIACYKVFQVKGYPLDTGKEGKIVMSPWRDYEYEVRQCYYEDSMAMKAKAYQELNVGFHSYSTRREAEEDVESWGEDFKVKQCTIPYGAKYFYNPDTNEYISDYLIIGRRKNKKL